MDKLLEYQSKSNLYRLALHYPNAIVLTLHAVNSYRRFDNGARVFLRDNRQY